MLLTDGSPNTIDELRVYESAVAEVAHTEMIDLAVKLDLATEEVAQDVLDFLLDRTGSDPRGSARRGAGVSDVHPSIEALARVSCAGDFLQGRF